MKTQVSNKNGTKKFETLSVLEMANIVGGKNNKTKTPKEKDVFDPEEK